MFLLTLSIHLCFGLPRFLLTGGTVSRVFLPTYSWYRPFAWSNHPHLAFLHLSVMSSFLSRSLSVGQHAHLHIFISVTYSFFTWDLVIGTVSIPYSIAAERSYCGSFPSHVVVLSCRIGRLTSSSSYFIHTVSSCLLLYSYHNRSAGCFPDI